MKSALLTLSLITSLFASQASACTCAPLTSNVPAKFDKAAAIFVGTSLGSVLTGGQRETKFKVERNFKGTEEDETIKVTSGTGVASCGIGFQKDASYLVFVHKTADGVLRTSLCSATKNDGGTYVEEVIAKLYAIITTEGAGSSK